MVLRFSHCSAAETLKLPWKVDEKLATSFLESFGHCVFLRSILKCRFALSNGCFRCSFCFTAHRGVVFFIVSAVKSFDDNNLFETSLSGKDEVSWCQF